MGQMYRLSFPVNVFTEFNKFNDKNIYYSRGRGLFELAESSLSV